VVKQEPSSGLAHLLVAKAQLKLGNISAAEGAIVPMVRANPQSADALIALADLYSAKKNGALARETYRRALKIRPTSHEALSGLTRLELSSGQPAAARAAIEQALTSAPDDPALVLLSGYALAATGDSPKAEAAFRRVIDLDPSIMDAYDGLTRIYLSQKRLDEAKAEYLSAIKKEPKTAVGATTMVGVILSVQGKHDEAKAQYQQALSLDNQTPVAANNLAWYYASTDQNLDEALALAQTAKAKLPDNWQVDDTLGWIYYKKGLTTLAITSLKEGAQKNPSSADVHYRLGLAYLKNGDQNNAQQSLQRALKLNPEFDGSEEAKRVLASMKG
jgi:tetratricopeptide (TPR) repeat protein